MTVIISVIFFSSCSNTKTLPVIRRAANTVCDPTRSQHFLRSDAHTPWRCLRSDVQNDTALGARHGSLRARVRALGHCIVPRPPVASSLCDGRPRRHCPFDAVTQSCRITPFSFCFQTIDQRSNACLDACVPIRDRHMVMRSPRRENASY